MLASLNTGGAVAAALDYRLGVNFLRDVVAHGDVAFLTAKTWVDEFVDQGGVDVGAVSGATYSAGGKSYRNAGGSGANIYVGGVASASSDRPGYLAGAAVDGATNAYWEAATTTGTWQYDHAGAVMPSSYVVTAPSNETADRNPASWTYEGWTGAAWVVLDSRSGVAPWAVGESRTYVIAAPLDVTKTRMVITANQGGGYVCVGEIAAYASLTPPAAAVPSVSIDFGVPVAGARLVASVQGIDAGAADYAAFDIWDGSAWRAVTVEDIGGFDTAGTIRVLAGSVSVSGQVLKWRWSQSAGHEAVLHNVYLAGV